MNGNTRLSLWSRLLNAAARAPRHTTASPEPHCHAPEEPFCCDLGSLSLIEVSDAAALAGELFKNAFRSEIPRLPRHFVLLRRPPDAVATTLGYVHYTRNDSVYLAGGLVVSAMEFRRLDDATADLVRQQGGMAEWLMRTTCNLLGSEAEAIFAYMGDAKSIRVNTRVGFGFTGRTHLYVLWKNCTNSDRKSAIIERVAALGPF